MNEKIDSSEKLYRSVNPVNWYFPEGRVCSSLFKNPDGVSVDRDDGREENQILNSFFKRFGNEMVKAVVYVVADFCYNLPACIVYKPEEDNEFHSEIHDTDKISLSNSKAKKLADNCNVIYYA